MKKTFRGLSLAGLLFLAGTASAATIIYQTADGKQNVVSKVKILSIDGNLVTLKVDKGTRHIARKALLKYYSDDISTTSGFEDDTQEYDVSIGSCDVPASGEAGSKKKRTDAEAVFEYSISRKGDAKGNGNVRMPYFYLFVLTTGSGEYGGRSMYVFAYPEKEARINSKNTYNEAKMLERALSSDRPHIHNLAGSSSGMTLKTSRKAVFKLGNLGSRHVLAWHLVVWGKDGIVQEKDYKVPTERISDRWWLHYHNN